MSAREERETDRQLVDRFKEGDASAFEVLYARHAPAVRRTASARCSEHGAVEEVVQEAFIRMLEALPSFEGGELVANWLQRVVCNLAADVGRRHSREFRGAAGPERNRLDSTPVEVSAEQRAMARWEGEEAFRSLAALPRRFEQLLVERELAGDSIGRIASRRGWTVGSTRVELTRARHLLRATARSRGLAGVTSPVFIRIRRSLNEVVTRILPAGEAIIVGLVATVAMGTLPGASTAVQPEPEKSPATSGLRLGAPRSESLITAYTFSTSTAQRPVADGGHDATSHATPVDTEESTPQVNVTGERPAEEPDIVIDLSGVGVPVRIDAKLPGALGR